MAVIDNDVLVIADIGGYTRYLTGVELEHSHDILADLIGVVADGLGGTLRVAKLEGDAVFCVGDGSNLLEVLRRCYAGFVRRQQTIALNTTCACDACRRIPDLDLKFVAHHGSFVEHAVAGSVELVGPDVILVHRLLKNSVAESFGLSAYVFLTDACVEHLGTDRAGLRSHSEPYEDIGEVHGVVIELAADTETSAPPVSVADEGARVVLSREVPATPQTTWKALTDPVVQLRWRVGATSVEADSEPGLGTKTHCVHGSTTFAQEIVQWQPMRCYSYRERTPIGMLLWTIELEPVGGASTLVTWRIALAGGRAQRMFYPVFGRRLRRVFRANMGSLARLLTEGEGFEPPRRGSPA